jgi:hypothetical protein
MKRYVECEGILDTGFPLVKGDLLTFQDILKQELKDVSEGNASDASLKGLRDKIADHQYQFTETYIHAEKNADAVIALLTKGESNG